LLFDRCHEYHENARSHYKDWLAFSLSFPNSGIPTA
jgi:hypothetical protein